MEVGEFYVTLEANCGWFFGDVHDKAGGMDIAMGVASFREFVDTFGYLFDYVF